MIIDSSAIVAIALLEPAWEELSRKMLLSPCTVAAPSLVEVHMVLSSRLGDDCELVLQAVISRLNFEVAPFGREHAREACIAFERFGKGRHPASLNFGDCVSYAFSKVSGQPLLYVGNDFDRTDIRRA